MTTNLEVHRDVRDLLDYCTIRLKAANDVQNVGVGSLVAGAVPH